MSTIQAIALLWLIPGQVLDSTFYSHHLPQRAARHLDTSLSQPLRPARYSQGNIT